MKVGFFVQQFETLGVGYISAVLKQAGHETKIWYDPRLYNDAFVHQPFLAKIMSMEDMIVEEIANSDIEVLGFSVVTDIYPTALRVARKIRERRKITTVFGGIHVTSVPEIVAAQPEVDYAVSGEGEFPMLELVTAIANGDRNFEVANVGYIRNGELIQTPARPTIMDLDELPFPDKDTWYDTVPKSFQVRYNLAASRGCAFACTFCNNTMMKEFYKGKGKWLRRRTVDNVINELKWARERYPYKTVLFWDEIFVDKKGWLAEFCEKYASEINVPFTCWAYPQFINPEVVEMLQHANCRQVNMGVQTINKETRQKYLKRGGSNKYIVDAIDLVVNSRISLCVDNIVNIPNQTIDEHLDNIRFYVDHRPDTVQAYYLRYYPRTEIVGIAQREGILSDADVERIENVETEAPLQKRSDRDDPEMEKIRTLYFLTMVLPRPIMLLLVDRGWYKYLPASEMTSIVHQIGFIINRWTRGITHGKRRFVYFYSVPEFFMRNLRFGLKKLNWKFSHKLGAGPTPYRVEEEDISP